MDKKTEEKPIDSVAQPETETTTKQNLEEVKSAENAVADIMKKYDRESNVRVYKGKPKIAIRIMLIAFSVYMILMNLYSTSSEQVRRSIFVGMVIILVFAVFPMLKGRVQKVNYIPWYDWVLGIIGSYSFFHYAIFFQDIVQKATRIDTLEVVLGAIGIVVLAEACRRVTGLPIIVVASVAIAYAFISGVPFSRIVYNLFYTTTGVIGVPIGVASTFIVLFIIFGAFLETTGISNFFISCANSIAGASSGGPAKVAVISSALCGMVSGSSVGNTVTTGSVTIPMMKKTGYPGEFAGAVEASASTGGQIMPPIMGAAAFLMAEICNVPYATIIQKAILPAFLYFSGVFLMVHFKAKKLNLKGVPKEELPKFKTIVKNLYLLLPLVVLVYMIIDGYTMSRSAIFATLVAIVVGIFNREQPLKVDGFFTALENGGKGTLSVAAACGMAGIIAGVVTMTGLAQTLISGIVAIAGNNLIIALFFTMISCIILGMGVPTTANYLIMATTCAPILTIGMNMDIIAANMFVFYFGIVADITPPVALAAYAGSAIAGSKPMKTALNATMLSIAAFVIPYIFAFDNALLFINTTPIEVVQVTITAFIGMFAISAGMIGYMFRNLNVLVRLVCVGSGLMLIYPSVMTDVIGVSVIVIISAYQLIVNRNQNKLKTI